MQQGPTLRGGDQNLMRAREAVAVAIFSGPVDVGDVMCVRYD
jgi:hypothetical protein